MTKKEFKSFIENPRLDNVEKRFRIKDFSQPEALLLESELFQLTSHPDRVLRGASCCALISICHTEKYFLKTLALLRKEKSQMVLKDLLVGIASHFYVKRFQKIHIQTELLHFAASIAPDSFPNRHLLELVYETLTVTQRPEQMFWKLATDLNWKEEVDWELLEDLMPGPNVPKRELTK